ncbi:hypothetical protein AB0N09_38400 [Streptomyces erythrochromogenes]|uniref:hypothetical protein n=1 Tax=Streptomyces erythrochromogenes TaxID=285574 RepID=UPI00344306B6
MHNDEQASPSLEAQRGPSGQAGGADYENALETVGQVVTWYTERILAERRAGGSEQRLEELMARRRACLEDQARLEDADAEETARIATVYDAVLNELETSGP